mmetsp:Transcript_5303/g.11219  ORF Transcript_5303/g.11219 Transcript_5303/m.11219 type:complete len:322 (-) Transcript_5303:33-998(-)
MEYCYYHHRRHHIILIVMSMCLQLMLRSIMMLRPTASAATSAASVSIGFHHSIQSRSHNHRRACRLVSSNNYQHSSLLGNKTLLRASSSQSSGSSSTSAPLKKLAPIAQQSDSDSFYQIEEIVKKSRFIGIAVPATSWDDAKIILEQVRKDHPKSRHVCFGFISSSTAAAPSADDENQDDTVVGTERASDDGEPTGTAGQPILNAIKSEELSDTLCIVVRYFGGIKLGAGGLIRAYGSAARGVLRSAPTVIHIPTVRLRLVINTQYSGSVYALAARFNGVTSGETYNDLGELEVVITCDEERGDSLREEIVDATRGSAVFL